MQFENTNLSCGTAILHRLFDRNIRGPFLKEFKSDLKQWFGEDENRTRTIVFSDVAGSTSNGSRLAIALAEHPELGTLVSTDAVVNRNSGNLIKTHMFSLSDSYMDELTLAAEENEANTDE